MLPPTKPHGTISPHSLRLNHQHQYQPRTFRPSHSFPLTSHSTHSSLLGGSSFASNAATHHPSEYLDRRAPIPEDWMIQLPSSPSAPSRSHFQFQPEVSLLIPDYNGLDEGDARLLRAASAMLAENENERDLDLLAQPQLIDFTQTQSQSHQPFRGWSSQPRQVISPLRIHPYRRNSNLNVKDIPTSSPDSDDSFDTPLSVRQKRRREQVSTRRTLFGTKTKTRSSHFQNSKKGSVGQETFYGVNKGDEQHTPTPIRYINPLLRSTSKFSSLDDEEEEEEEVEEKGREIWSPELVDMDMDTREEELRERESSVVTVVMSTPIKESSSATKGSEFELDVKEESDEEDYPSSPFLPTPIKTNQNRRHSISTTPLKLKLNSASQEEVEEQEDSTSAFLPRFRSNKENTYGNADGNGGGRVNEKGLKKAIEFREYLDGERSGRDPRFDLKVFHWILTGCPEVQWSPSGYGIEIKDVPAFYKNVLHKEAREKREVNGKKSSQNGRDLPGKTSFERQLSGYGFKRVTIGKFMTIERPDLRRDNHDLLRKVQEVWQVIEHGNLMPKVKLERATTTSSLRTRIRNLENKVIEKDVKLEQVSKFLTVLAKGEIVSPGKINAIVSSLDIEPHNPTTRTINNDNDMNMNIDPQLLTPVDNYKPRTRSKTIPPSSPFTQVQIKHKAETIKNSKKNKAGAKTNQGKVTAKSKARTTFNSTLASQSINIPSPTPITRKAKSNSNSKANSKVQEENTPLKSVHVDGDEEEMVGKKVKKGRGKKRV